MSGYLKQTLDKILRNLK